MDLPLIWAGLIATGVLLYVMLDGFDLGVGILFPFARTPGDRDVMMNTIAPVWDGNETWLVLGGGGLLAAFPTAYAVLMPAFYLPILMMLIGLVLRGVAFEFRFRARKHGRWFWTAMFALGSILATFAQGLVLGGFIQGVTVENMRFAGGTFDWLTPYCLIVAFGLVAGYALLGATWLVLRTQDDLHGDARRWAAFTGVVTALALVAVSISTLVVHHRIGLSWGVDTDQLIVDWSKLVPRLAIPALGFVGLLVLTWGLAAGKHGAPFLGALMVFLSGYFGLAISFFPYIVPYALDIRQAAAPENALALMLVGAVVALPLIVGYTAWVYWVFRGKVTPEAAYH